MVQLTNRSWVKWALAWMSLTGCVSTNSLSTPSESKTKSETVQTQASSKTILMGEALTEQRIFVINGFTLPYRMHAPQVKTGTKRYPLVVFLHGSGERGQDNTRTLVNGVVPICQYAIKHGDAFVVVPQCPQDGKWVNKAWGGSSMRRPVAPTEAMAAVMALVQELRQTLPIDENRIYVTGVSMGGGGAWDLVTRLPNFFAAVMPICGCVDETTVADYASQGLGIRFFHGSEDRAVTPEYSRRMDRALTASGVAHDYVEYPGVGHASWTNVFADEANLAWLFSQQRTKSREGCLTK